jgi:putative phosphonate metabolism protein
MTDLARYALYFTPAPQSALNRFGSRAIGYNAYSGSPVVQPRLDGVGPYMQEAHTAEPKRYGFHGTLKAPFRLREPFGPDALLHHLRIFATRRPPVAIGRLKLAEIGGFLALVPDGEGRALDLFAGEVVATFDKFRAPLGEAERARRMTGKLSSRQEALLDTWGYPYVFDEFRFHMTLTGKLPEDIRVTWRVALVGHVEQLEPVTLDAITLLKQADPTERFRVVERVKLTVMP